MMHARSAGSGAIKEVLTVLPSGRNAGSVANPITSRPSATAGIVPGVHPRAKARKARRKEKSHLARRPNSRQIQSYCKRWTQTRSFQHQPIRKMLGKRIETRSFQDHHFKRSIPYPPTSSLAVKSQADLMEVVQPRIRCTWIRTLKAGWPSTLIY